MELKMSKTWKRVISFVLAFAMAFSFTPVTTSLAAPAPNFTVTITPQANVEAAEQSLVYGSAATLTYDLSAEFEDDEVDENGFVVNDTAGLDCNIEAGVLTIALAGIENAGEYTIKVGNTTNNGYYGYGERTITINKKQLAVKAKNYTKTYSGTANADLENIANFAEFKSNVPEGVTLGDVITYSWTDGTSVANPTTAGAYTVTLAAKENGNYVANILDAEKTSTLTINKKPIKITARDAEGNFVYGDLPNAFTSTNVGYDSSSANFEYAEPGEGFDVSGNAADFALAKGDAFAQSATFEFDPNTGAANDNIKVKIKTFDIVNGAGKSVKSSYDWTENGALIDGVLEIGKKPVNIVRANAKAIEATSATTVQVKYTTGGATAEPVKLMYDKQGTPTEVTEEGNTVRYALCKELTADELKAGAEATEIKVTDSTEAVVDRKFAKIDPTKDELYGALPAGLAKGFYLVYYKVTFNNNYKKSDLSENDVTGFYVVEVKSGDVTRAVTVNLEDWTYGDEGNEPTVSNLEEEGFVQDGNVDYTYYEDADMTKPTFDGEGGKPIEAGQYWVKATVHYTNLGEGTGAAEFNILPKTVKIFISPVNASASDNDAAILEKAKVSVQAEADVSYNGAAKASALVGEDTIADNFNNVYDGEGDLDISVAKINGVESIVFNTTPTVKTANYKLAATNGVNPGAITRKLTSMEQANAGLEQTQYPFTGSIIEPVLAGDVTLENGTKLVKGTDYSVSYYAYTGRINRYDEKYRAESPLTENDGKPVDIGKYVMVLTGMADSKNVIEGTELCLPFEITKIQLYAKGLTVENKTYDGTDVLTVKKGNITLYSDPQGKIGSGINGSNVVLKGYVYDADGNKTENVMDKDGKVQASSTGVNAGTVYMPVDNLKLEFPENGGYSINTDNYEIQIIGTTITAGANKGLTYVSTAKIEQKTLTVTFAQDKFEKTYGESDANTIKFALATGTGYENNTFAERDMTIDGKKYEAWELLTPKAPGNVGLFDIRTKRSNVSEDATLRDIDVTFDTQAGTLVSEDGNYKVAFLDGATTALQINPIDITEGVEERVHVSISKDSFQPGDDAASCPPTVTVRVDGVDGTFGADYVEFTKDSVPQQFKVDYYAASTTNSSVVGEKLNAAPKIADGPKNYFIKVTALDGTNLKKDTFVYIPFEVTGERLDVELTLLDGNKKPLTVEYDPESDLVLAPANTIVSIDGEITDANEDAYTLGSLFKNPKTIKFNLTKMAAGDQAVTAVIDGVDLSKDIPANQASSVLSDDYKYSGKILRVKVNPVKVTKKVETPAIVTEETVVGTKEENEETVDVKKELAGMWVYGETPATFTVKDYTVEENDAGEVREVKFKYYDSLEDANEDVNGSEDIPTDAKGTIADGDGYYVRAFIGESRNYAKVSTEPAEFIIEKAPLRVKAKSGSRIYLQPVLAEDSLPDYEAVETSELRGVEKEAYDKLTDHFDQEDFLDSVLNHGAVTIQAKDADAPINTLKGIWTATAGTYNVVLPDDNVLGEFKLALSEHGGLAGDIDFTKNYKLELVPATFTVNPIDLTADYVKTYLFKPEGDEYVDNWIIDYKTSEDNEFVPTYAYVDPFEDLHKFDKLNDNGTIVADTQEHEVKAVVTASFTYELWGQEVTDEVLLNLNEDYVLNYYNASGMVRAINPGHYTIGVDKKSGRTVNERKDLSFDITNDQIELTLKAEPATYGDEEYYATIAWKNEDGKTNQIKITEDGVLKTVTNAKLAELQEVAGEDVKIPLTFLPEDNKNAGVHRMQADLSVLSETLGRSYVIVLDDEFYEDVDGAKVPVVDVEISKKDINKATIETAEGFDAKNVPYVPGGVTVDDKVKLVDGDLLDPDHDYVCQYKDNETVGTATLTFNASNKGGSNYTGTRTFEYDIVKSSIANAKITVPAVDYTGAKQSVNWKTAKVTVVAGKNADGTDREVELTKDVDFTVVTADDDCEAYGEGTAVGKYPVKIQGAGNFDDTTFATGEFEIKALELAVTGITVESKTYDGTTKLVMSGTATLDPELARIGWSITKQPTAAVAASKDAGTQDVILEGYEISSTNATNEANKANYVVVPYVSLATHAKLTAEIKQIVVEEFEGVKLKDKVYDGSAEMAVEGNIEIKGGVEGDDIKIKGVAEKYEAKEGASVGDKTYTILVEDIDIEGADAKNYSFTKDVANDIVLSGKITPKEVTVSGLKLKEKVYDGKAEAEIEGDPIVEGIVAGESIGYDPASNIVTIDSADAGERTFTIKKEDIQAGLKGDTKDNYVVAKDLELTGVIKPADVAIEGDIKLADKEYDGLATMTVDASGAKLTGVIDADKNDVKIDVANQYAVGNSDAGEKTAKIEVKLTGEKVKNYVLKNAEYEAKGKITPKTVKASGLALKKRVYDQTATMTVDATNAKLDGVLDIDKATVTLSVPETVEVADKNAGTKKATVKVALNQSANNYVLEKDEFELTGTITKKGVTLANMKFKDKYYDGSKYMILTSTKGVITGGVLDGDDVAFETKQNNYVITGTKNAGSKKRKLTRGLWNVTGKDAANYQVAAGPTATGTIKKITVKKVTLKATSVKYTGKAQKPVIKSIVGDNGSKILQKNCKVQYYRNGKTTTDFKSKGTITVKVTGVGSADAKIGRNWTGSVSVKYTIK